MRETALDAFVVTYPADLTYLTEHSAAEGYWLVVSQRGYFILTNKMFEGIFVDMGVARRLMRVRMDFKPLLEDLVKKFRWKKIGFDGEWAPYNLGKYFTDKGFKAFTRYFDDLRMTKDEEEIQKIREACRIAARTVAMAAKKIKPGVSERDLMLFIERAMKDQGAERNSFDLIIGSGPNSAIPHYKTGARKFKNGDAVIVDIGCVWQNYCSDITRTFFVGKNPGALYRKIYSIVERAQKAGVAAVRSGLEGRQIDRVCRELIEKEGMADNFTHGTGHGLGLEIHEAPWVRKNSDNIVKAGSVITIEPGIYLPGKLGVRIEDTVLVGDNGAQILTKP